MESLEATLGRSPGSATGDEDSFTSVTEVEDDSPRGHISGRAIEAAIRVADGVFSMPHWGKPLLIPPRSRMIST